MNAFNILLFTGVFAATAPAMAEGGGDRAHERLMTVRAAAMATANSQTAHKAKTGVVHQVDRANSAGKAHC